MRLGEESATAHSSLRLPRRSAITLRSVTRTSHRTSPSARRSHAAAPSPPPRSPPMPPPHRPRLRCRCGAGSVGDPLGCGCGGGGDAPLHCGGDIRPFDLHWFEADAANLRDAAACSHRLHSHHHWPCATGTRPTRRAPATLADCSPAPPTTLPTQTQTWMATRPGGRLQRVGHQRDGAHPRTQRERSAVQRLSGVYLLAGVRGGMGSTTPRAMRRWAVLGPPPSGVAAGVHRRPRRGGRRRGGGWRRRPSVLVSIGRAARTRVRTAPPAATRRRRGRARRGVRPRTVEPCTPLTPRIFTPPIHSHSGARAATLCIDRNVTDQSSCRRLGGSLVDVPVDTPGTFPVNETVVAGVIGCRVPAVTRKRAAREEAANDFGDGDADDDGDEVTAPVAHHLNGSRVECSATRHCRRSQTPLPRAAVCSSTTRTTRRGRSGIQRQCRQTRRPRQHSYAAGGAGLRVRSPRPLSHGRGRLRRRLALGLPTSTPRTLAADLVRPNLAAVTAATDGECALYAQLGQLVRSATDLASAQPPARAATTSCRSSTTTPPPGPGTRARAACCRFRGRRGREQRDEGGAQFYTRIGCGDGAPTASVRGGGRRLAGEGDHRGRMRRVRIQHASPPTIRTTWARTARWRTGRRVCPTPSFSPQQCSNAERTAGTRRPSMIDVPLCPSCLPHWSRRRAPPHAPTTEPRRVPAESMDGGRAAVGERGAASKAVT